MGAHKIPIIIIIFIVRLFERIPRPAAPRRYATACPGQRENVSVRVKESEVETDLLLFFFFIIVVRAIERCAVKSTRQRG